MHHAGEQNKDGYIQGHGGYYVVGFTAVEMLLVSYRISPAISRTNIAETAGDSTGMSNVTAPKPARKLTRIPTIMKPPKKRTQGKAQSTLNVVSQDLCQ